MRIRVSLFLISCGCILSLPGNALAETRRGMVKLYLGPRAKTINVSSISAGIDGFSGTAHTKAKYMQTLNKLDADWVSYFTVTSPEFDGNNSKSYNNGISYKVGTSLIKPIKLSDSGNNLYLQAGINHLSESVSSNRYDSEENLVRADYRNGYNYATLGALYEVNNNLVAYHRSDISIGDDTHKNGAYYSRRFGSHGVFGVGFEWNEMHSPEKINTLKLNGHERFKARSGLYFNYIQPYDHRIGSPLGGINTHSFALSPTDHKPAGICNYSRIDNATLTGVHASVGVSGSDTYVSFGVSKMFGASPNYSFALNPEEHQPSGSGNLERIDNTTINIMANDYAIDNNEVTKIYTVNYNVYRVMSGMGGLAYSN